MALVIPIKAIYGVDGNPIALGELQAGDKISLVYIEGAEASGAATAAMAAHVAETDPHGQYALEADLGNAAYRNVGSELGTVAAGDDTRLSDSREWTAATISQADAEAGTDNTRKAWTALRVRQAIAAWWESVKASLVGPVNITANSASDALKITQSGAGNALVVEDTASPDSTPFVINSGGQVVIGSTTPRTVGVPPIFSLEGAGSGGTTILITRNSADTSPSTIRAFKTRGVANGSFDAVNSSDNILQVLAYGADGAAAQQATSIILGVDGAVSAGIVPGKIVFYTTTSAGVLAEVCRMDSSQVLSLTSGKLKIALNAGATKLLQSDASGNAVWGPAVGQADAALPTNADIRSYYGIKGKPSVAPTLVIDFENSYFAIYNATTNSLFVAYSWDAFATHLGADLTITRAGEQTYFDALGRMRVAPANTLQCDHDPFTGRKLGVYSGESRTNICRYSADHTQWTLTEATLDDTTWTAPDGTAARIWTASAVAAAHRLSSTVNATTVGTSLVSYSWFVYIPPGSDVQRLYLRARSTAGGYSSGQLATLSVTGSGASAAIAFSASSPFGTNPPSPVTAANATIQALGGGVFRLGVTSAVNSDAAALSTQMDITWSAGTTESVEGTANTRIGVWGWQCEVGKSISPYIPVPTDASVVRAATTVTIGGAKFTGCYNQMQGTFVLQYNKPMREAQLGMVMSVGDGTTQNRMYFLTNNSSATAFDYFEAATAGVGQGTTGNTATTVGRAAFSYATNNVVVGKNGVSYTDSTFTVPAVNKLDIGHRDGVSQINGHLTGVTYYPVALSTTTVAELAK